jgi:predicted dehydrogenase
VDTVSIAAPNHWHALAAIWAMQAGKHVYVEKPVSHNVSEGRRIVQVAEKTGRLCQAGTQNRSDGALAAAGEFIRSGKLGDVTFARSIIYGGRGSIGPRGMYEVPRQVDYNLFMGPAADVPLTRPNLHYDWHWDWNTGNGELGNNNIHYIDICRWMMGLKGLGDSVISVGGRLGYEDAGETPNTQMVVHTFGPVTVVQEVRGLKSDPFSEKFRAGHVIHGTEGFIAESSLFDPDGKFVRKFEGDKENHFANFIKAVRDDRREDLNADILEGHQSSALCHVGNISYRLGQPEAPEAIAGRLESYGLHEDVPKTFARMAGHLRENGVDLERTRLTLGPLLRIEPGSEVFSDHREANALLTREYRRPFVVPAEGDV